MEKKIITISREFGSGGRTMGRKIAEKLGIPFYDKELVEQIAVDSGFHAGDGYIRIGRTVKTSRPGIVLCRGGFCVWITSGHFRQGRWPSPQDSASRWG